MSPDSQQPISPDQEPRIDDLPPVEPPSAGFIVQLFLVPAVIVMVVVGVWVLFGQIASSEQDMTRILADLKTSNENRRWRAAFSMAQMLEADSQKGSESQQLAKNSEVANELTAILKETLAITNPASQDLEHQTFLARTLGWFDLPDVVLPALIDTMNSDVLPESTNLADQQIRELQQGVRNSALTSVARMAGRLKERGSPLANEAISEAVISVSGDAEPSTRQLAAFTLGLISGDRVVARLESLLLDADKMTRINSAIALARHNSTAGFPIFKDVLEAAQQPIDPETIEGETDLDRKKNLQSAEFVLLLALQNSLEAISNLAESFTDEQRVELIGLITPISEDLRSQSFSQISEVRHTAGKALTALNSADG